MEKFAAWVLVVALLGANPSDARDANGTPSQSVGARDHSAALQRFLQARRDHEGEVSAYWVAVAEKRRSRFAKRHGNQAIDLNDYVLSQPPVYTGPPPPPGYAPQRGDPAQQLAPIPVVADFVQAAADQFDFVPQRVSETEFKLAYARAAAAAGLTKEQAVGIYAFETGGNGTYDVQAGLTAPRKNARPISPALGYNQLLSTNTVGLLAEHGDKFVRILQRSVAQSNGVARKATERKIVALKRMVAFSRTVPNVWHEHDRLAKTTRGGMGIHAAVLDRDIGPLLQTQKLVDSVEFARIKGHTLPLSAVELELMNLTGDGNGLDMVLMPQWQRERVPTANFFQRRGYERNPIARHAGTVAALFAAIKAKMDRASQEPGARELAAAF